MEGKSLINNPFKVNLSIVDNGSTLLTQHIQVMPQGIQNKFQDVKSICLQNDNTNEFFCQKLPELNYIAIIPSKLKITNGADELDDNNGKKLCQGKQCQEQLNEESLEIKNPKSSIIQQLDLLVNDQPKTVLKGKQYSKKIENINCIETDSYQEGDSYIFSENQSDIVQLSTQQKKFFSNFMQFDSNLQNRVASNQANIFSQFSRKNLMNNQFQTVANEPMHKRNVIRNFFRPKGSLIKDEKTCCNSQTFLEEVFQHVKLNEIISENIEEEVLTVRKNQF